MRVLTKIVVFQSVSLPTSSPENISVSLATPLQHCFEKPTVITIAAFDTHNHLLPCPKRYLPFKFLYTACGAMAQIVFFFQMPTASMTAHACIL